MAANQRRISINMSRSAGHATLMDMKGRVLVNRIFPRDKDAEAFLCFNESSAEKRNA